MAYVPKGVRNQVIQRARGFCEYCYASQAILVDMEIDHIVPERAGGTTTLASLCLSCFSCNAHKRQFQTGLDSHTNTLVRLFHLRHDRWENHFRWSGDYTRIIGISPTGRATVERLQMNRESVVMARRRWLLAGWKPE
jgi:hypothetical protein